MDISAKLAPTFQYPTMCEFRLLAEDLGFHGIYDYDHFYGLEGSETPTFEGWAMLTALAAVTKRARVGCIVTSVTFRHPAVLANMAATVDHISDGRLDFGIGAGWHDAEHHAYGLKFPEPADRVEMLDEALIVVKRLWTEAAVTHDGRFFTLRDAVCNPRPLQPPYPPIVIGASRPRMMGVVARHADEWNFPVNGDIDEWSSAKSRLERACKESAREMAAIRCSVQLFLHPAQQGHVEAQLRLLSRLEDMGCDHVILSFYEVPSDADLNACADAAAYFHGQR